MAPDLLYAFVIEALANHRDFDGGRARLNVRDFKDFEMPVVGAYPLLGDFDEEALFLSVAGPNLDMFAEGNTSTFATDAKYSDDFGVRIISARAWGHQQSDLFLGHTAGVVGYCDELTIHIELKRNL